MTTTTWAPRTVANQPRPRPRHTRPNRPTRRCALARYYDPTTAQFLTRDPLELVTRSAYGYVGNNPINTTDPTGLCWGPTCIVEDAVGFVQDHRQGIADGAAGVLSGLTFGNQDLLLPKSAEDNYNPNSMAFQRAKPGGAALLLPFAIYHPIGIAGAATVGSFVDIARTCSAGWSQPGCIGTSSAATVTHAAGMLVNGIPVVGPHLAAFVSLFGSMWDSSWFESQFGC